MFFLSIFIKALTIHKNEKVTDAGKIKHSKKCYFCNLCYFLPKMDQNIKYDINSRWRFYKSRLAVGR